MNENNSNFYRKRIHALESEVSRLTDINERIEKLFDITRDKASLIAGEMTAQEWRTLSAMLEYFKIRLKK